jgi:hypothetical protein
MKDLAKAFFSYSLAVSFFGLKQVDNLFRLRSDEEKGPATKSFEAVTAATTAQFGDTLTSTFRAMDNLQRGMIELAFSVMWPFGSSRENVPARSDSEPRRWTEAMMEQESGSTPTEPSLSGRLH